MRSHIKSYTEEPTLKREEPSESSGNRRQRRADASVKRKWARKLSKIIERKNKEYLAKQSKEPTPAAT